MASEPSSPFVKYSALRSIARRRIAPVICITVSVFVYGYAFRMSLRRTVCGSPAGSFARLVTEICAPLARSCTVLKRSASGFPEAAICSGVSIVIGSGRCPTTSSSQSCAPRSILENSASHSGRQGPAAWIVRLENCAPSSDTAASTFKNSCPLSDGWTTKVPCTICPGTDICWWPVRRISKPSS